MPQMKKKMPRSRFDALIATAEKTLREAMREKGAQEISVFAYERTPTAIELFWHEREERGALGDDGIVEMGRKS